MNTNFDNLQIGDEVAYNSSRNYFHPSFGKVVRVTKTQLTVDDGRTTMVFSKNTLQQIKVNYSTCRLIDLEQAKKHIEVQRQLNEDRTLAKDLEKALNGHRSGNGYYHLNEAQREAIKLTIEALTK